MSKVCKMWLLHMYILHTYLHTHVYRYYVAHQKPAPFKSYVRNMLFQGLLFTDIAPSKLPHLKSKSLRFLGRLVNAVATAAWYAKDLLKVCEAYQSYRLMLTLFETFWWKLICGEVIFWTCCQNHASSSDSSTLTQVDVYLPDAPQLDPTKSCACWSADCIIYIYI